MKRTLIVRQNRIAASAKTAGLAGLPSGGARPGMSLQNQIGSDPRLRSEALSLGLSVVRWRAGDGLRMQPI